MHIVGKEAILAACSKHPDWCSSLWRWLKITETAQWKNFGEVRQTFASASYVAPFVIFNIAGNKARLATLIDYENQLIAVESVRTHAEYDRKEIKK